MQKHLQLYLWTIVSIWSLQAQSVREWPLNDYLNFTVNPAAIGQVESMTVGLSYARKWQNVQSSPIQADLGFVLPFENERMGLGAHVFSERVGPFSTVGMSVGYAYKVPLGLSRGDYLAMGMSGKLMHIKFDQTHFIASHEGDALLSDVDGTRLVPPAFSVGIDYSSGEPTYAEPVQLRISGSVARFFPFQNRFNTLSFDRIFQWYAMAGMSIAASEHVVIEPALLLNQIEAHSANYGARICAKYKPVGWVLAQYSKAGFLTSQLGLNLGGNWGAGHTFLVTVSNSWYFGTLSAQIGNSLTFGFAFQRSLDGSSY